MMENFIRLNDLDLVYLQEVTHQFTTPFSGYDIHYNIGSTRRGTAFLIRTTLKQQTYPDFRRGALWLCHLGESTLSTYTRLPAHQKVWKGKLSSTTTSPTF